MQRDARAFLWDVRDAADAIAGFSKGQTFDDYAANLMLRSAIERQLEIIGEALNRLSKTAPDVAARISELPRAIGLRNILIHGYDEIENATIWSTVEVALPQLRAKAAALLDELGDAP